VLRADLCAGSIRVALLLGQDLEILAPPRPEGDVVTLVPVVVHRFLEFLDRLVDPEADGLDCVRDRVADEVASAKDPRVQARARDAWYKASLA
jgi:hypothetical protein